MTSCTDFADSRLLIPDRNLSQIFKNNSFKLDSLTRPISIYANVRYLNMPRRIVDIVREAEAIP